MALWTGIPSFTTTYFSASWVFDLALLFMIYTFTFNWAANIAGQEKTKKPRTGAIIAGITFSVLTTIKMGEKGIRLVDLLGPVLSMLAIIAGIGMFRFVNRNKEKTSPTSIALSSIFIFTAIIWLNKSRILAWLPDPAQSIITWIMYGVIVWSIMALVGSAVISRKQKKARENNEITAPPTLSRNNTPLPHTTDTDTAMLIETANQEIENAGLMLRSGL